MASLTDCRLAWGFGFAIALLGCEQILGLGDPQLGAGGNGGATTGSAGGGGGGGGSSSVGGAGGSGGAVPSCDGCTGEVLWSRAYGTTGRHTGLVATVIDGDVVFAATSNGDIDLGGGTTSTGGDAVSITVARLDSSGDYVWHKRFTGVDDETPHGIAALPSGDVVIVGEYTEGIVFDGYDLTSAAGVRKAFAARLDGSDGGAMWLTGFDGAGEQVAWDVAASDGGRIAIIGEFDEQLDSGTSTAGATDVFVAQLKNDDGSVIESFTLGSTAGEEGQQIAFHADGDVVIVGDYQTSLAIGGTSLPDASQTEIFLAKVSLDGAEVAWATSLGGNNYQYARALDLVGDRLVLAGGFQSELRFGGTTVPADYQNQQYLAVASTVDGSRTSTAGYAEVGSTDRDERVLSPAFDGVGHVVAAGWFEGLASFGAAPVTSTDGGEDIVAFKAATDGTLFWSQTFGDASSDRAHAAATDGEETLIVGVFEGELTLEQTHVCPATSCIFVARLAR